MTKSLEPSQEKASVAAAGLTLYATEGARLYLTASERTAFLKAAERADREDRTLCMTLAYSGCRLSEALALTVDRVWLCYRILAQQCWRILAHPRPLNLGSPRSDRGTWRGLESQSGFIRAASPGA
jgi:hypothetical protein